MMHRPETTQLKCEYGQNSFSKAISESEHTLKLCTGGTNDHPNLLNATGSRLHTQLGPNGRRKGRLLHPQPDCHIDHRVCIPESLRELQSTWQVTQHVHIQEDPAEGATQSSSPRENWEGGGSSVIASHQY